MDAPHAFRPAALLRDFCLECEGAEGAPAHAGRGRLIINSDGSQTLLAPHRPQQRAQSDPSRFDPPDPFD